MAGLRLLLISNARPSRAWRFANRALREAEGARICGILQVSVGNLSPQQRILASPNMRLALATTSLWSRIKERLALWAESLAAATLWFVHGCPERSRTTMVFTAASLAEKCEKQAWAFGEIDNPHAEGVARFIDAAKPDLIIALGEVSALPALRGPLRLGWLRTHVDAPSTISPPKRNTIQITIQQFDNERAETVRSTSLALPRQAFDTPISLALKSDLIADDLLLQSLAAMCVCGPEDALPAASRFAANVLGPYLNQVGPAQASRQSRARRWYRAPWSLALETLLLCSPLLIARNWLRRIRGGYPVLILVHHLVSDRAHRMSMSTESFWRQILFLCRHYRIVSLREAASILRSGRSDSPAVALTFDDGYADNFISLRAVANEFDIPVAMFVTTGPVELRQEFQHDVTKGLRGAFALTWPQIRYWKERGAEFGSHTRTHIRCGQASRLGLSEEIVGSKRDFEARLGESPTFFAFPYGTRQDLPRQAVEIAAASYPYFLSAFGGENFPNVASASAHLMRKNAYPEPWELELELQSVFDLVGGIKRLFHRERKSRGSQSLADTAPQQVPPPRALEFEPSPNGLLSDAAPAIRSAAKPS